MMNMFKSKSKPSSSSSSTSSYASSTPSILSTSSSINATFNFEDPKKSTLKILDCKKDPSSRLKYLKLYIDSHTHENLHELKLFFDHYYSHLFHTFYEFYTQFELSINKQAKIKFNKEDLDLILYTFEKILILQPERLQQRWQARSIGNLLEKLLHIGNTKTIKIEGTRLFLIWYQILNINKTLIEELLFQKLINGFDVFHTQNTSAGLDLMNAEAYKVFNSINSDARTCPVELSSLIPSQSSLSNITSELMHKLLESLQKDCLRVEWYDRAQTQKCFEFLYDEFKRHYLVYMFPQGFVTNTRLLGGTFNELPSFDRLISDERKTTQVNCKEEVIRWLINILLIENNPDTDPQHMDSVSQKDLDTLKATSQEENLAYMNEQASMTCSYYQATSSTNTGTLAFDSPLNKHLAQRALLSNVQNINLVHEILRQAFVLNFDDSITIQRVLHAYRKWFLYEASLPLFMLEPDCIDTNETQNSTRIGFTKSLQIFFSYSINLFLNPNNLNREKISNILLVTLDVYKILIKKVQIDYNTWVLIITVLLKISDHLFNVDFLINNRTESSISQLIKSLTETILLSFERASYSYNISNDLWDQLMVLLSSISTYSDVIDKWIESIDNLLKYMFKKFYNLDISNLDVKQEDWTRTRKSKIRSQQATSTYSSVIPTSVLPTVQSNDLIRQSSTKIQNTFRDDTYLHTLVKGNIPSIDQVIQAQNDDEQQDDMIDEGESDASKGGTLKSSAQVMNRFSSEKSIYYSSDKLIDDSSFSSVNNSATSQPPQKPHKLDLPCIEQNNYTSDSSGVADSSDLSSRYERNLKTTSLYGDFEQCFVHNSVLPLDTPSESSDPFNPTNDGSVQSLNNYGSLRSDKSYSDKNAKDILVTLVRRLFGSIGNINQIRDEIIHKKVFDFLHEKWLIFAKCKYKTTDLFFIDFAPWLFEAIYQLSDDFKEGKLVAYKTLCKMAMCYADDVTGACLSDDFIDLFYVTIHLALNKNDDQILNCIIETCSVRLWHLQLPSCTLLLLDFVQACNLITKTGPKHEAACILATLSGYSNYFFNDLSVLKSDEEVETLSADTLKDILISNLSKFQAYDDNKTRTIIISALTCFIYEETISSNWNRKRLLDALKPLFDDLECKDGNLVRTRITCENLRFLAPLADRLFEYDSQYPIDIIAKLNNSLLILLNPHEAVDFILNDDEYIKTVVSCMFSMLDWYMYFPFVKIKKSEKKILLNNFFRLLNHASVKFKQRSNSVNHQHEHICLAAKFIISHLLTQQNHFPFGQSNASKIISSVNESSDNGVFGQESMDDLNTSILTQPNVQFFTLNNQYLVSFIELTNKSQNVQYLTSQMDSTLVSPSSSLCRFIIRDYCGKYCWDSTMLSASTANQHTNQLSLHIPLLKQQNDNLFESNSAEISMNTSFDYKQLPFVTNANTYEIDILDQLLQYLSYSSPECRLNACDAPLNLISKTSIPSKLLGESVVNEKISEQMMNESRYFKLNHEVSQEKTSESTRDAQQLLSYYRLCKSFIHQMGLLTWEKRLSLNLLRKNTQLLRELKSLDDQTCRETHKIAIIYIGSNQQDKQTILSNECGSQDYEDFINSLAWTIDLETHEGFMGGLPRNTKLKTAMYYATSTTEILFHVSTRMNTHQEDNKISKWRHLGNDSVQIIWSEHKRDYNRSILATEFADVLICVYPMKNSMFRIQIDKKPSIGLFGPLFDGAIVNKQVLPALVRATAVNASRVLLSKISGFKEFYVHRAHAISNIIRTQTEQETFEQFLADIYSPAPSNYQFKRDIDFITLNSSSSSTA